MGPPITQAEMNRLSTAAQNVARKYWPKLDARGREEFFRHHPYPECPYPKEYQDLTIHYDSYKDLSALEKQRQEEEREAYYIRMERAGFDDEATD